MFKNIFSKLALVTVAIICFQASVEAQMYSPDKYDVPVIQKMYDNTYMTNIAVNGIMKTQMLKDSLKNGGAKSSTPKTKLPPTQFRATGVPLMSEEEFSKLTKNNRQDIAALSKYTSGLLDRYIYRVREDFIPANDVAAAVTYFLVNNYLVAINYLKDPDQYRPYGVIILSSVPDYINNYKNIYRQVLAVMMSEGSVEKMKDADKEKLSGVLALVAGVTIDMYERGVKNNDAKQMLAASEIAKSNLEKFLGLDINKVSMTNAGIRVK